MGFKGLQTRVSSLHLFLSIAISSKPLKYRVIQDVSYFKLCYAVLKLSKLVHPHNAILVE